MAGNGNVRPVSCAPCTQPEMAVGNRKGQIYTSAHNPDSVGRSDSPLYVRLDGSGILLSRYVFTFLPKHGGYEAAQKTHILCAYWGFVCMSLHLGFHWSMMLAMARKHLQPSPLRTWSLRLIGWLWAVYGAFAFRRRGVSLYLLLRSHFVFYDYSEPVILFLIDYLFVMALFTLIGYYLSQVIRK